MAEGFGMGHAELEVLGKEVEAGCGGVTVLPFLAGERAPNWPYATGGVLGLKSGRLEFTFAPFNVLYA